MPYYVYAIHTDSTDNRLFGKHEEFQDGENMRKDLSKGNVQGDNYFVRSFHANDDIDANKKAGEMRPQKA